MQMKTNALTVVLTACSLSGALAFVPTSTSQITRPSDTFLRQEFDGGAFGGDGMGGGMEEIEFTIHPDGRITEVVRGVKGANCQKITEEINKQLGTVVHTENTEEMFEQELAVEQTVNQEVDGGWGGTTPSW